MKIVILLFFSFLLSYPLMLSAQSGEGLLPKVSAALAVGQEEQAVALFGQAIIGNPEKSEMYYWTTVDKNSNVCPKLASKLASYYKKARNYDKAYLFYRELLQKSPNDVNNLNGCAEMEVYRGREDEALRTYEKVLELDADNLSANIFVGNYYYLMAEQEKQKMENEYKKITAPTRMQYANYRNGLNRLLSTRYEKAKEYLQNVIRQFPSTEAQKTLNKIQLIEKEMNR